MYTPYPEMGNIQTVPSANPRHRRCLTTSEPLTKTDP